MIEFGGEEAEDEERVVGVIAASVFMLEHEVEEAVATLNEGSAKTDLEWSVFFFPHPSCSAESY